MYGTVRYSTVQSTRYRQQSVPCVYCTYPPARSGAGTRTNALAGWLPSGRALSFIDVETMGFCGGGKSGGVDAETHRQSARLARQIAKDAENLASARKLLLLGAGESGKSTIFKQMRIINSAGYSTSELSQFRYIIHRNILDAIKTLVENANHMNIELQEENEDSADQVLLWDSDSVNPEMAEVIERLWNDSGIKKCYSRRAEFHLLDNAAFFLGDVRRVAAEGFVPSTQDALNARVRTSGVVSKEFQIEDYTYLVYDVGGQRSERRKWLPLFDHVTAIVFVAALNDYDQVVPEDRSKNRMQESLDLFQQIVNSKHFVNADVILFLNKKDLFEEKIKIVDPKKWFPDYTGGCDYTEAEQYFLDAFRGRVEDKRKTVYSYTTCATDTKNVSVVLDSVKVMLVSKAMNSYGF